MSYSLQKTPLGTNERWRIKKGGDKSWLRPHGLPERVLRRLGHSDHTLRMAVPLFSLITLPGVMKWEVTVRQVALGFLLITGTKVPKSWRRRRGGLVEFSSLAGFQNQKGSQGGSTVGGAGVGVQGGGQKSPWSRWRGAGCHSCSSTRSHFLHRPLQAPFTKGLGLTLGSQEDREHRSPLWGSTHHG